MGRKNRPVRTEQHDLGRKAVGPKDQGMNLLWQSLKDMIMPLELKKETAFTVHSEESYKPPQNREGGTFGCARPGKECRAKGDRGNDSGGVQRAVSD